jgi:outer membrane protein assembly factor BamA
MSSIFTLLLLLLMNPDSQVNQQLFFYDNVRVIVSETREITEYQDISVQQALSRHLEKLSENGFLSAVVDSIVYPVDAELSIPSIFLNQGPRYSINQIQIFSNGQFSYELNPKSYYSANVVEDLVYSILDSLSNRGFPFARAVVDGLFADSLNSQVNPRIQVQPGEEIIINDITFSGLQQLNETYLKRRLMFTPGLAYNPEEASRYHQILLSNLFVIDASEPELIGVDGQWNYFFRIEEVRPGAGDILLGYNPSEGRASAFVGRAELRLDNLITLGSRAELMFEKLPAFETRLYGTFSQLWIGMIPLEFSLSGNLHQKDSTFTTRGVKVRTSYNLTQHSWIGWSISSRYTDADERHSDSSIADGRNVTISLDYGFQKTDRRVNPTRGYQYAITVGSGYRSIVNSLNESGFFEKRNNFIQVHSDLIVYLRTFPNQVLVPSINAHYKSADVFFRDDLKPIGGALSFRGYGEEQFLTSRYLWADTEYRYLLDRYSYIFVFGAAGRVYLPESLGVTGSAQIQNNLVSTGLGLAYRVRIGMLRFTYAFSSEAGIDNGKVHFGISNTF